MCLVTSAGHGPILNSNSTQRLTKCDAVEESGRTMKKCGLEIAESGNYFYAPVAAGTYQMEFCAPGACGFR